MAAPRRLLSTYLSAYLLTLALACSATPRPGPRSNTQAEARTVSTQSPEPRAADSAQVATPVQLPPPALRLLDPALLQELERRGLSFESLLGRLEGRTELKPRSESRAFAVLQKAIERDLDDAKQKDPNAGVGVARFSHRLFDVRWLSDRDVAFELIGVVNRFDRFAFRAGTCGEVRLIYRLSYTRAASKSVLSSRLPMTLGFEFTVPQARADVACADAVTRFRVSTEQPAAELAELLRSTTGPLADEILRFDREALRVVINVQQVRWPSTVRPDFAGHAEYLLRAFRPDAEQSLVPEPLENTLDTERILKDPTLKREFLTYLSSPGVLHSIDNGNVLVPEKFLALRAVSVTPRGLARFANRPFRAALTNKNLEKLDVTGLTSVRSSEALLRRLDQLSCPGCHQARSVAGFHLLGEDLRGTPEANALSFSLSPHSLEDDARRSQLLGDVLAGSTPSSFQPFAERADLKRGNYGAHCGLGSDPSFANWTCDPGLSCTPYDEAASEGVGICLPETPGLAGDPCEVGIVGSDRNAHRDRMRTVEARRCAAHAVCNSNRVGFPGGMCAEGCVERGQTTCGAIAILDPFNACLARGEPFTSCLEKNVRAAGLRACSASAPCRDDYICARTQTGSGACIPPYFLFQLRVDGHP